MQRSKSASGLLFSLYRPGPGSNPRRWRVRGEKDDVRTVVLALVSFCLVGDIRRAGKLSYWVKHLIKAKQEKIIKFDLLVSYIPEGLYSRLGREDARKTI